MTQASSSLSAARPSTALPPLLYRFDAQLAILPLGVVPEGLRMANSFEGTVTRGLLEGARVWGIDHLLLRTDGVAVIDAQKTISLGDTHVYEHVRGYGLPPEGLSLPSLDIVFEPEFSWPDVRFPVSGSSTFRASAPELLFLNRAIARVDGWFNFTTGGLAVETRLLNHFDRVEGPEDGSS